MALTPEETAELKALRAEAAQADTAAAGSTAVAAHAAPRAVKPQGFSTYRTIVGGFRDAIQGVVDTADDIGTAISNTLSLPAISLGADGKGIRIVDHAEAASIRAKTGTVLTGDKPGVAQRAGGIATLPKLTGEDQAGTAERVARSLVSFVAPFTAATKIAGTAKAATFSARAGRAMLAGAAVDFTQVDPVAGNIATFIKDTFGIDNAALNAMAGEADDDRLTQRFKAAATSAPLGLAADALMEGGVKAVRAYRELRAGSAEAKSAVAAVKDGIKLKRADAAAVAQRDAERATVQAAAAKEAEKATPTSAKTSAKAATTPAGQALKDLPPAPAPVTGEDILSYLQASAKDARVPEDLGPLAREALDGTPENALGKAGIDPLKIDYSAFDDPATLGRLHAALGDAIEGIADGLGRTGEVVTERVTTKAARALGSTPDVLRAVHGATKDLASYLTGARIFVGGHAHKLVADASSALDELTAAGGNAGPAWDQFLESMHRHAYFMGTLRGAGSEVGRALQSLQFATKVKAGRARLATAGANPETARAAAKELDSASAAYAEKASKFTTNEQRIEAISRLLAADGDLEALALEVRRQNGGALKRLDGAIGELRGNLFTVGSATLNVLSGFSQMGLKVTSKLLASTARLALSPLHRESAEIARKEALEAWGYSHGIVSGFGQAFGQAIDVFTRDINAELSLNMGSFGLSGASAKAARKSAAAADKLAGHDYSRVDLRSTRSLSLNADEMARVLEMADSVPGPQFFNEGLKGLVRIMGTAVNTYGSLTRLGTTAFVNAPDQFAGVLAARAGSHAAAIRVAASEAAEAGLEGKALSSYIGTRSAELADGAAGYADDAFEAGQRETMIAAGETERANVLFQDDFELAWVENISRAASSTPFLHLLIPFIKTPLRILEQTALDYTPLGFFKDNIRRALLMGGPQGDEAKARLALGIFAVVTAAQLSEDRTIIGTDGGYKSSARLQRPSYTLRVGGDLVEFNRLDPLGTLLGMGADLNAFYKDAEGDDERAGAMTEAFGAFVYATSANVLSKTWLTSIKQITDLMGATSDDDQQARNSKFLSSFASRFVPAAGIQKYVAGSDEDSVKLAYDFTDNMLKNSLGAASLPARRDILGRPVESSQSKKLTGFVAGPSKQIDRVADELEELSANLPMPKRVLDGVRLTAPQFSRLLELRGQVVQNPATGLTLDATLKELIDLPDYKALGRNGRVEVIRQELNRFGKLAKAQLADEDKAYAYKVLRNEVGDEFRLQDKPPEAADAETRRLAASLGLKPVD